MPYFRSNEDGGHGGGEFADNLTETCRMTSVTIRSGTFIDAITCQWVTIGGNEIAGERHGGGGGQESPTFFLEKDEFINRIEGRAGDFVDQLKFFTNKGNVHGPFGGNGGHFFSITNVHAHGFFGRSGAFVDRIGVFTPGECP